MRPEDFAGRLPVSADPAVHLAEVRAYLDLGYDRVLVLHVGPNQAAFLRCSGEHVLPALD